MEIHEINRAYLSLIREMAIRDGTKAISLLTGMEETALRRLVEMSNEDIDEIASLGLSLIKVNLQTVSLGNRCLAISRLLEEKLCTS